MKWGYGVPMRDLDELEASVRDPLSRPHFQEAVRAFRSGAYRAAVVEAWVAVALDLTNKIRNLAETGDGEARDTIEKLDKAIATTNVAAMQQHERNLLKQCEQNLELLTVRERTQLQRLYDDRNLCAHPAFVGPGEVFAPSAELVRGHLATAADCALALPPVSGKKIIENFERVVNSDSWPEDADLVEFLRTEYFTTTRHTVHLNLAKLAMKQSIQPPRDGESTTTNTDAVVQRCRAAFSAIEEFEPEVIEEAIAGVIANWERSGSLTDEMLLRLVGSVGHLPCLWRIVSKGTKSRVTALLNSAGADLLVAEHTFSSGRPADPAVAAAYEKAVEVATADFENLERLVQAPTQDRAQWVKPVLAALRAARSFRSGERRLRCLLKIASHLSSEDLKEAAASIRENNQIFQASDTPELLLNLYRETSDAPGAHAVWLELAKGLHGDYMKEHTDPDGYYSYKKLLNEVRQ